MKILITGGAGFQGSNLTEELLDDGHDVTILNTFSEESLRNIELLPKKPKVVWGSVTDPEIVDKTVREHEVVFHLAARINVDESIKDPKGFIETNVNGTYNVLEATRKHKNRLIHASTCEVYGSPTERKLISESAEFRPHSPYAASKAAADRLCFAYYKTYGVNVSIARPFNIYGEKQKEGAGGAAIAIFVKNALSGKPITLFGDGSQTRDYMNISDLVLSYKTMLKSNNISGEAINFGTGKETSIKEIAEYIAEKLDAKIKYGDPRPGEVKTFVAADIEKAKKIGFEPKVSIWDGIDRYIKWRKSLMK